VKLHCVVWIFVLLVLAVAAAPSPASDTPAIAHAVDDHYNRLRSLRAEFVEIYQGSGVERTESGTVWLKKPGKMRWEYRSPREKLFLGDGKNAWFYLPGDRQVRRTSMRKLDDLRSPLAFLLGKTRLEKELQGLSLAPDVAPLTPGNIVLRGVPTVMAERVTEVLLEVTPKSQIARISMAEADGSVTEYRFTSQEENLEIDEQRFRFTPPAGAEVVDGDIVQ
jgi:outer membrane lipoprotein carrier protein